MNGAHALNGEITINRTARVCISYVFVQCTIKLECRIRIIVDYIMDMGIIHKREACRDVNTRSSRCATNIPNQVTPNKGIRDTTRTGEVCMFTRRSHMPVKATDTYHTTKEWRARTIW